MTTTTTEPPQQPRAAPPTAFRQAPPSPQARAAFPSPPEQEAAPAAPAAPAVPGPVTSEVLPEEPERKDDLPTQVTIELGRPIKSHFSPTTTSLTFREPTAMDIDAVGNPITMDFGRGWPPLPVVDAKKMTQMLARLAHVAPSSILQMTARDWSTCSLAVQIFFLPDLAKL